MWRLFTRYALTFSFAARFLPAQRRDAATALYAFCRHVDDLADEYPPGIGRPALASWQRWLVELEQGVRAPAPASDPTALHRRSAGSEQAIAAGVLQLVDAYGVPPTYLRLLVGGVAQDLDRSEVRSFAELHAYCFSVAGTVGLAMCHVLGATDPAAWRHAELLGIAMQLTNVLRDVGEDLGRGRVYLPQDELERFGLTGASLLDRTASPAFVAFMRWQAARARAYYAAGLPGIFLLPAESQFPILLAARLYRAILGRIEAQDFDVFRRRASTSRGHKVKEAVATYAALRLGRRHPVGHSSAGTCRLSRPVESLAPVSRGRVRV